MLYSDKVDVMLLDLRKASKEYGDLRCLSLLLWKCAYPSSLGFIVGSYFWLLKSKIIIFPPFVFNMMVVTISLKYGLSQPL